MDIVQSHVQLSANQYCCVTGPDPKTQEGINLISYCISSASDVLRVQPRPDRCSLYDLETFSLTLDSHEQMSFRVGLFWMCGERCYCSLLFFFFFFRGWRLVQQQNVA